MNESPTTHHTDCNHISGTGWCCAPQCDERPVVAMAGRVVAAFAEDTTVEVWCQSPTGGETDSLIFRMACRSAAQAEIVASQWRDRWGIDA